MDTISLRNYEIDLQKIVFIIEIHLYNEHILTLKNTNVLSFKCYSLHMLIQLLYE